MNTTNEVTSIRKNAPTTFIYDFCCPESMWERLMDVTAEGFELDFDWREVVVEPDCCTAWQQAHRLFDSESDEWLDGITGEQEYQLIDMAADDLRIWIETWQEIYNNETED